MTVTGTNLVQGPAALYYAAFETAEPADSAVASAPGGSWTDLGATDEGLTLTINREFSELTVDQVLWVVATQPTKVDPQIKTNLAEATLQNLAYAMNGGTVTTSGSYRTYDPDADDDGNFQPTYFALLVDGWAPGAAKRRRIIARKCLSIDTIESAFKKDGKFMYPVTFRLHYVSTAVKPLHIVDAI